MSSVSKGSRAVSEFVLEDAEAGKEHTSKGERYVARPSFMQGLRKVFDSDASAEEVERLQGAFSIDYMLNKARQWAAGALNKLGGDSGIGGGPGGGPTNEKSPAGQPISEAESLPHPAANRYTSNIEEDALRRHHLSPEARLIAFGTGDGTMSDAGYTPEAKAQGEQAAPATTTYDTDSVIADAGNDSRSNLAPSSGGRTWEKAKNAPVSDLIKHQAKGDKQLRDYIDKWEVSGEIHEVKSVPKAILETYSSLINDPRRNQGEFNFAFAQVGDKIYMSRVWFNPGVKDGNSELQEPLGIRELENRFRGQPMTILAHGHSHPLSKDKAYWNFSPDDLTLGRTYEGFMHSSAFSNQGKQFVQVLLTPSAHKGDEIPGSPPAGATYNSLMFYKVDYHAKDADYVEADKAGRIVQLGQFTSRGRFIPDGNNLDLLKKLGFVD